MHIGARRSPGPADRAADPDGHLRRLAGHRRRGVRRRLGPFRLPQARRPLAGSAPPPDTDPEYIPARWTWKGGRDGGNAGTYEWAIVVRGRRGRGLRCDRRGGRADLRGDPIRRRTCHGGPPGARDRPEGTPGHPGVWRRARASRWRRLERPRCDLASRAQPPRIPRHHRRVRPHSPTGRLGARRGLVLGGVPRRYPVRRRPGSGGPRPSRLPAESRRSQRLGQPSSARPGRDHPDVPDPSDGRIERDEPGEPSGALHDGATRLVSPCSRPRRPPIWPAGCARARPTCTRSASRTGTTPWSAKPDIGIPDAYATYRAAAAEGWLTAHVNGFLWWDRTHGAGQIADLLGWREHAASGRFRATRSRS